ncbi:NAD kinase 2, mitochondrial isoform X2 [Cephus cinctus]|uniref:NAD kinase 2, mitochondrial isoform X2 n=1 Tax=Cephus cinctus TaxID=211228 RepID=A0AAJ7W7I2_CEPCN|nr:NAD kinase 2, mitochondrial isoform X2 [Cephus cinctus]
MIGGALQLLHYHGNAYKNLQVFRRCESSFVPKRVVILAKISRYYFEKLREPNLKESELKQKLIDRGSNYDAMLASHYANKTAENQTVEILRKMNIEYRIMNRLNLDHRAFVWADFILPIGGDGTFLLASNLIFDNCKPIMGINSDPTSSEGFLMLPVQYTKKIPEIFELLKAGQFRYLMRTRIRITLKGKGIWNPPFHMHEKGRYSCAERFYVHQEPQTNPSIELPNERRLPWLALNEVFMGESLSARTSSLQMTLENEERFYKVKSSGLCVSTGTGSTSWHTAINSLSPQTIKELLKEANPEKIYSDEEIKQICKAYNKKLRYPPEDPRLCYSIRDMIVTNTWQTSKDIQPRGYCNKLTIRSQCFDAGLVLDGGIAVPFNDGTIAVLEVHPEDALRTIVLPE